MMLIVEIMKMISNNVDVNSSIMPLIIIKILILIVKNNHKNIDVDYM